MHQDCRYYTPLYCEGLGVRGRCKRSGRVFYEYTECSACKISKPMLGTRRAINDRFVLGGKINLNDDAHCRFFIPEVKYGVAHIATCTRVNLKLYGLNDCDGCPVLIPPPEVLRAKVQKVLNHKPQ